MSYRDRLDEGLAVTGEMLTSYLLYSLTKVSSRTGGDAIAAACKSCMGDWITQDPLTIKKTIKKHEDWYRFLKDIDQLKHTLGIHNEDKFQFK